MLPSTRPNSQVASGNVTLLHQGSVKGRRQDIPRNELSNHPDLLQFFTFCRASNYKELLDVVVLFNSSHWLLYDFNTTLMAPSGPSSRIADSEPQSFLFCGFKRVLNRPDVIGASADSKIEKIASKLAGPALFARQNNDALPSGRAHILDKYRPFFFCTKTGHSANRCEKYADGDSNDHRDGKMVKIMATCSSRPKAAVVPVPAATQSASSP